MFKVLSVNDALEYPYPNKKYNPLPKSLRENPNRPVSPSTFHAENQLYNRYYRQKETKRQYKSFENGIQLFSKDNKRAMLANRTIYPPVEYVVIIVVMRMPATM